MKTLFWKMHERAYRNLPGVRLSIGWDASRDNQQFELYLRGDNTERLEELAHKVAGRIEQVEGVMSVDYAAQDGSMPEIQLHM